MLHLNHALLLGVVLLPFLATLLGSYGQQSGVVMLYGADVIFIALILQVMALYALRNPGLRLDPLDPPAVNIFRRRGGLAIIAYGLGIPTALFSPALSQAIYFAMPLIYILPTRFDAIW